MKIYSYLLIAFNIITVKATKHSSSNQETNNETTVKKIQKMNDNINELFQTHINEIKERIKLYESYSSLAYLIWIIEKFESFFEPAEHAINILYDNNFQPLNPIENLFKENIDSYLNEGHSSKAPYINIIHVDEQLIINEVDECKTRLQSYIDFHTRETMKMWVNIIEKSKNSIDFYSNDFQKLTSRDVMRLHHYLRYNIRGELDILIRYAKYGNLRGAPLNKLKEYFVETVEKFMNDSYGKFCELQKSDKDAYKLLELFYKFIFDFNTQKIYRVRRY